MYVCYRGLAVPRLSAPAIGRMPACFPFGKSKAKPALEEELPPDADVREEKSQAQQNAKDIAVAEAKLKVCSCSCMRRAGKVAAYSLLLVAEDISASVRSCGRIVFPRVFNPSIRNAFKFCFLPHQSVLTPALFLQCLRMVNDRGLKSTRRRGQRRWAERLAKTRGNTKLPPATYRTATTAYSSRVGAQNRIAFRGTLPKGECSQRDLLCEQGGTSTLASSRTTNSTGAVSTRSLTASDTTANGDTACNTASAISIGRTERSVGLRPHPVTLNTKH
jgi:hypothetical protein